MSIYNITDEFSQIMAEIESNGGEISPEIDEKLQINQFNLIEKTTNYVHVIKTLDSECDIIDIEIKRLQELKKQRSNFTQSLKDRLKNAMQAMELTEIKTALNKINFRKSESVEIIDADKIPKKYKTIVIEEKPNKTALKEYLNTLPKRANKYAKISTNMNISIK